MAIAKEMKKTGGWMMFLGVLYLLAGLLCVLLPLVAGMAVAWVLGIALAVLGVVQVVGAFQASSFGAGIGDALIGLLYLVVGVLVLMHPIAGLAFLSTLIVVMMLIHGILLISSALQIKPEDGWGWILFGGILSVVLAVILILKPTKALWLPGLLVGIDLLFSGWTILFTGGAVRSRGKALLDAKDAFRDRVAANPPPAATEDGDAGEGESTSSGS